jgi:hypothetical protein
LIPALFKLSAFLLFPNPFIGKTFLQKYAEKLAPETGLEPATNRLIPVVGTLSSSNGSRGRIRTYNQPVNSRLLYH